MNRRTLLRRLGAGAAGASAVTGLASADDGPVVFEETTIDGETVFLRAGMPESQRRELSLETACDCPLCPRCYPCKCDDEEELRTSLDRTVVVR